MLSKLIDRIAGTPKELTPTVADMKPGRVAVEGHIQAAEPIIGPIAKGRCVGYFYKATHQINSRLKGFIRRRLRDALVYAPDLRLEMPDGVVALVPRRSELWSPEQHAVLVGEDYQGFQATEKLIPAGARVRVVGKARREPDGSFAISFAELHLLDDDKKTRKSKRPKARAGFRQAPRKSKGSGKGSRRSPTGRR